MLDRIKEARKHDDVFTITLDVNLAAKWVIRTLAEMNIPFKVIQLGGGVKRITTDTEVCPKCNGTGRC